MLREAFSALSGKRHSLFHSVDNLSLDMVCHARELISSQVSLISEDNEAVARKVIMDEANN